MTPNKQLPSERKALALRLRNDAEAIMLRLEAGEKVGQIALEYGCTGSTVARQVQRRIGKQRWESIVRRGFPSEEALAERREAVLADRVCCWNCFNPITAGTIICRHCGTRL